MRALFFAGSLLLIGAGSVAYAQETGSLIKHRPAQIDRRGKDAARQVIDDYAECVVSRSTGRAVALTEVPIDSPKYRQLFKAMTDEDNEVCLSGGTLYMNQTLFRGSLYQALYARMFAKKAPMDFSNIAGTGYRQLYADPLSGDARQALALVNFGECVSRANPEGVRSLLAQLPGTPVEAAQIKQMMPQLSACIPQDNTITFSPSVLKGALAEGIYRLSVASRASVSTDI